MGKPRVFGADYSVYVRIVRLVLSEKQIDYELAPVDVFAPDGVPEWYLEHHPFGRIPAFEHDGFRLFETSAIARYVDEAFPGPALQPVEPKRRAVMNQTVGMLDAYAYRAMVWDVAVERLEKPSPDEALVAAGLDRATTVLRALSAARLQGPWLMGDLLTLADLHAAPIIGYFAKAPEGRALLAEFPGIQSWHTRMAARPSFSQTEPAS